MNTQKTAAKLQGKKAANKIESIKSEILVNKVTSKVISKPLKVETKKEVTYLAENVTGKQLRAEMIQANRLNKDELQSLSFQLKQFNKHGENMLKLFRCVSMEDITPKNILPFLTEKEKERQAKNGNKFSFYLVENLVNRYAKSKIK